MEAFQDTTLGIQREVAVVEYVCIHNECKKKWKSTDEGANSFMKYCNACNIKLIADLSDEFDPTGHDAQDRMETPAPFERLEDEQPEEPGITPLKEPDVAPLEESDVDQLEERGIDPMEDRDVGSLEGPDLEPMDDMAMEDIEDAITALVRTRDTRQSVFVKIGTMIHLRLFAVQN